MEKPPDPDSQLLQITISNPDQPSSSSCGDDLNSSHHESFSNHSRNCDFVPLLANDKVRTSITLDLASFPLLPSNPPNLNLNSTTNQLHENPQISMSRTLEIEKSTWASKLGTKGIGKTKLGFIPPTMVNGEPIIHLESSQFGKLQQKNENLVIGSFVSKRESFEFVKGIVSKAWKIKGKFTMKFYGRKSFSFAFEDEVDKAKAIEFGNFHIASQVFLVRPWKLFIEADLKNLEIIPIWVLFKKIPEELWNGDGFSRIASAIGEPLYPDRKTEQKTKTDYARICIDVKATSTFPTIIPVVVDKKKVFKVTAEYNWRPPRCMHCKVFGHSEINCSRVHKGKKQTVWAQKETAVEESAKVIETRIVSEVIEIEEDAQKQHLEVMEEDVQEQESNGEIATSVITPSSPHIAENTNQEGEIRNQKESDLEDIVVTSITPMTTSINGGATIQVANGFRFLEDDEEIPESMKSIMEQVDLVNSRMSAFLDKNKGGSSQQSPIVDRVKQKTGGGRGRQKGASSSKTVSDATDESNLGIRKSQREPNAPVRLNLNQTIMSSTSTNVMSRVFTLLYDFSVSQACYLINFQDIHESLLEKMNKLKALKKDVDRMVNSKEATGLTRLYVVDNWMSSVESIEAKVDKILSECLIQEEQRCVADCCLKNVWACYKLGKEASKKIVIVEKLINDSDFRSVAAKPLPSPWQLVPEEKSVGTDVMFQEVWTSLGQEGVTKMGIYGMGGVGKTLLLKNINNKFCQKHPDFDVLMYVSVSKKFSKENIQKQIGEKLGLTWSKSDDENTKKDHIFNQLNKKRFVVLLDDIWEMIDLEAIGLIPVHNNFKVVFTTRSKTVCAAMGINKKFEVPTLHWEQAWDLFQQKVGKETLEAHPNVLMLAQKVAKECGGLPLALIAIGKAMSNKETPPEWEDALSTLQKHASNFSGMDKVLSILKFSYENLESDTCRDCFLYFSLYPEDWTVYKTDIIMHWIGEGLLEESENTEETINKGHSIIGILKEACLLEADLYSEQDAVKMHDVMRDLALWIARECGKKNDNILVEAGVGLKRAPNTERWRNAKRVSLMRNDIEELTEAPESPHLLTLLLQRNYALSRIGNDFFQYMPNLRVLNLSTTAITVVPESIGSLLQLQSLDLSLTKIRTLPDKMEDLKQLKLLFLASINSLIIPHRTISRLSSLQVLRIDGSGFINNLIQKALECLKHLSYLGITIEEVSTLRNMLTSPRLRSSISSLQIYLCENLAKLEMDGPSLLGKLTKLRQLYIVSCRHLEELIIITNDDIELLLTLKSLLLSDLPKLIRISWIERAVPLYFKSLSHVQIYNCNALKDMSWLILLPVLRNLSISVCNEMEEIIPSEFAMTTMGNQYVFSGLHIQNDDLVNLPKLKSISTVALLFPALKYMYVVGCPLLRTLPFTINSAKKPSLQIKGEKEWWNGLQWENETIKTHFQSFFVEVKTESEASTSAG